VCFCSRRRERQPENCPPYGGTLVGTGTIGNRHSHGNSSGTCVVDRLLAAGKKIEQKKAILGKMPPPGCTFRPQARETKYPTPPEERSSQAAFLTHRTHTRRASAERGRKMCFASLQYMIGFWNPTLNRRKSSWRLYLNTQISLLNLYASLA